MLLLITFSCFVFRLALDSSSSVILMVRIDIFCPTSAIKSLSEAQHTHFYNGILIYGLFLPQNYQFLSDIDLFESSRESSNNYAPLKLITSSVLFILLEKLSSLKIHDELFCPLRSQVGVITNSEVCLNLGTWHGFKVCFSTDLLGQFLSILPCVSSLFLFSNTHFIFSISSSQLSILYSLFDLFGLLCNPSTKDGSSFFSPVAKSQKYCLKYDLSFCVFGIQLTIPIDA